MKEKILTLVLLVTLFTNSNAQLIQGTIKSGPQPNQIEIWIRPDFPNSTQYIYQFGLPIAFSSSVTPQPTSIIVTQDPAFIATFGNNYSVTVYPKAHNTANTENYFSIALVRGGGPTASDPQIWVAGTEYKVLTATFVGGSSAGTQVKLADYQDGGSDGQGNFYTVNGSSATYYVSPVSSDNFYSSVGQSSAGGSGAAGFAQTSALISLPIHLLSFSGFQNGTKNSLHWSTTDEMNNAGFDVQRSYDGVLYTSIGFVPTQAPNGNSAVFLKYEFSDNNPSGKKQYYRLKQVDLDNRAKLSQVVMISGEKSLTLAIGGLFPNPSTGKLNATLNSPQSGTTELSLIDMSGKILYQQIENIGIGSNTITIDISKLSKGNYLLQAKAQDNNKVVTHQFLKQ